MKYRIKSIRREGWVETEEQLFRPADQVAPVAPADTLETEDDAEIYIISDEEAPKEDDTVVFTPPAPIKDKAEEKADEKKPLLSFLKTKEGKVIVGVIGGFALLLIIFIIAVLALSSGNDNPTGDDNGSNADHTHTYQTVVDEQATCTEKGLTKEKCSTCGYTTKEEIVDPLGHKWKKDESASIDATCEEEGIEVKTCERCGEKESEKLEQLEHDWDEDLSDQATCEEDGTIIKECKNCGKKETEKQEAKGHTWIETSSTEATCEKEGEINSRCASCKETKKETTAKKEHDLTDVVRTEPTCSAEGKETATCTICKKTVVNTIEKLPHELEDATCEHGERCKVCGEEVSAPLPHNYSDGVCIACGADLEYTGAKKNITVGEEMLIGAGISLRFNSLSVNGDELTLGITLTVTKAFTAENYYFTPDKLRSMSTPTGNGASVQGSQELFNLPSSGSVKGTVTAKYDGSGDYVLTVIGENNVHHTCSFTVE